MRTGIYARLFIPIFFLILLVIFFRYHFLIETETAHADARYRAVSTQLGSYLSGTLLPAADQADQHDDAALATLLSASMRLDQDLVALRWSHAGRHLSLAGERVAPIRYPDWFRRLTGLRAFQTDYAVALRDGSAARLSLSFAPTADVNTLWDTVCRQAQVTAVNVLLIYGLLGLILFHNRRMLGRLAEVTRQFRAGRHNVRMRVQGTLESRALAQTFNDMAGEVQHLLQSLQASQAMLGEQMTQSRQMQSALQEMSWQNYHDALTGLPNRAALAVRFEQDLFRARERQRLLAVCLFDLDGFQEINRRFGEDGGDEVLKQVASRLHTFAGQSHYAAHLGGDEFVLLLCDQDDRGGIAKQVGALLAALAHPYQCDGQALTMSASAGVSVYTGKQQSADTLLRHADQALYQAKLTGRNRLSFFDDDLDEAVRSHHSQRSEIRDGMLAGQFRLHYQPKVNMRSGEVVGMEALLRWQHPQRGLLGPMLFLPLADQSDLIIEIGEWVLRQALRQMQQWGVDHPHWVVSVNIAARHFQRPDFVGHIRSILDGFPGVPPTMRELEILESSALDDIDHVRRVMTACQELGIAFALDDFGTGYSSMSYLKRLPANILKIDQSFVRNMLDDQDDLHLVGAIIGLAKSFNLAVIAEGVETLAHGAQLMRMGCDLAQGYGIARPMPPDDVPAWAAAFTPAPAWCEVAQEADMATGI